MNPTNTATKPTNSKPSTVAQAASADQNTAAIQNLLQSLPSVIPLRLTQGNITYNFADVPLNSTEKVSSQAINLLDSKINTPLIYAKGAAIVNSQRQVAIDAKQSVISLEHAYYGSIGILGSISAQQISDVQYLDKGYLVSTANTTILKQIPPLATIQDAMATMLTNVLSNQSYLENKTKK